MEENHRKVLVCFSLGVDMGGLLVFARQNLPGTDLHQTLLFESCEDARTSDSEIGSSSTCCLMELFFPFTDGLMEGGALSQG